MKFPLVIALMLLTSPHLQARQDPAPVKKAIEDYLRVQTQGLPGQVSFTLRGLDPENRLAPCATPVEVAQPPGARTWGRTHVSVRCPVDGGWSAFVPVHVRVVADYLVTARPLSQGQTLTEADLARQNGDLSDLPAGILTEAQQAVGRTAAMSIAAGRPLRADLLRQPMVIRQNQTVKVVSRGAGFQVASEGRALADGADGQVVQARLPNGQVVSGIARAGGVIEISH
ncbi:MAG: flagellar basal body P-ring formation chaperone FlgA [Rhodocyclaceae bacterium]|nr:flagellar basal body P-ring formation chaperone FlgA [Rhodocyclaceae bacterium]